jgi:transcriptional regulator with XRE-family HTH domain
MDLRSYRQKKGWTLESAAKFAGFANGTVWRRYETGERYPRPDALHTIENLTGGEVTASDLLEVRRAWERKRRSKSPPAKPDTVPA